MVVSEKEIFWNIVLTVRIPFFLFTTLFKQEAVVAVQSLSCVQLFATPWTAMHQASLTITISQSLLKFMSTELVILFNHLKQAVAGPESKLSYNPLSSMFQEAQAMRKMGFTGDDKMRTLKERISLSLKKM